MNTANAFETQSAESITLDNFYRCWKSLGNNEIIIDLRSPVDYARGHIPGSINIPYDSVIPQTSQLQRYKKLYFHCYGGEGAQQISQQLSSSEMENIGFLENAGFDHWRQAGYPVAAD